MVLSQGEEISPATATTTEGEEDGTVGTMLGVRILEYSLPSVSLKLELRRVRDQHAWLAATVNEYKCE